MTSPGSSGASTAPETTTVNSPRVWAADLRATRRGTPADLLVQLGHFPSDSGLAVSSRLQELLKCPPDAVRRLKNTMVRRSARSLSNHADRADPREGGKPMKTNASVGRPDVTSAARSALGPGMASTGTRRRSRLVRGGSRGLRCPACRRPRRGRCAPRPVFARPVHRPWRPRCARADWWWGH